MNDNQISCKIDIHTQAGITKMGEKTTSFQVLANALRPLSSIFSLKQEVV